MLKILKSYFNTKNTKNPTTSKVLNTKNLWLAVANSYTKIMIFYSIILFVFFCLAPVFSVQPPLSSLSLSFLLCSISVSPSSPSHYFISLYSTSHHSLAHLRAFFFSAPDQHQCVIYL